jgi:uncharacterized protein YjeT (DUF2065 family)
MRLPLRLPRAFRTLAVLVALAAIVACSDIVERADPKVGLEKINSANFKLDVEPILRGTVASEAMVTGFQPVVVRGYGLVVGLEGTGSRLMPADVRAFMLQEMARKGVGNAATGFGDITPERMLDSGDCAVVIVEGVIPPGAPKEQKFDVRVFAVPGSGSTSLEGGTLWTTELRPGPLVTGNRQAKPLAEARGPIFINPFVQPRALERDAVNRLSGRILEGGSMMQDMVIRLRMSQTSHTRAKSIESAINSTFPREDGQAQETAKGRSGDAIDITVPPSYRDDSESFVQLLSHTPLLVEAPEQTALYVRRALLSNPGMADAASWRWRAIGKKAVPMIQDLYDYPEEQVRMAALVSGAHLDDPLSVRPLLTMAKEGEEKNRLAAIGLLADMGRNPAIDVGLRELLDDEAVDVRLAVFDTLEKRKDPLIGRLAVDDKFSVHLVPSSRPMLYVAQTGTPRIVVFDESTEVTRPVTFSAWSNRLMVKADEGDPSLQVFYRPGNGAPPEVENSDPKLIELIPFLGHTTTIEKPTPGIGLSYAETIGALHQLWRAGYVPGDFKAEQDRILAAIIRAQKPDEEIERPEFDDPGLEGEAETSAVAGAGTSPASDLADLDRADVSGASGRTVIERTGLQRDTVPR